VGPPAVVPGLRAGLIGGRGGGEDRGVDLQAVDVHGVGVAGLGRARGGHQGGGALTHRILPLPVSEAEVVRRSTEEVPAVGVDDGFGGGGIDWITSQGTVARFGPGSGGPVARGVAEGVRGRQDGVVGREVPLGRKSRVASPQGDDRRGVDGAQNFVVVTALRLRAVVLGRGGRPGGVGPVVASSAAHAGTADDTRAGTVEAEN
jgi:hypothetical protein